MATTRAKFSVSAIEHTMGSQRVRGDDGKDNYVSTPMVTVKLAAVYGNGDPNHENTKFWESSPSGQVTLSVINLPAAAIFELGKEYYLDFTPAP